MTRAMVAAVLAGAYVPLFLRAGPFSPSYRAALAAGAIVVVLAVAIPRAPGRARSG